MVPVAAAPASSWLDELDPGRNREQGGRDEGENGRVSRSVLRLVCFTTEPQRFLHEPYHITRFVYDHRDSEDFRRTTPRVLQQPEKCTRRLVLPSGFKRYPRGVLDRSNTRRVSIHCVIRIIRIIIRSTAPLQCRVLQALVPRTERIIGTSIV